MSPGQVPDSSRLPAGSRRGPPTAAVPAAWPLLGDEFDRKLADR